MMVAVGDSLACLKLAGRASLNSSVDFKTFVNELLARGYRQFVLDLTDCLAMDSTFLGVLAGFAQRLAQDTTQPRRLDLINASPRITDFLENLGALPLFTLRQCPGGLNGKYQPVPGRDPTKAELSQVCLEAHRILMELSPANVPKFKDITRFLAEDLKKAGEEPGGAH